MPSITNWVSGESDKAKVESAQVVLQKVKHARKGNEYQLVKIGDHPLTFKEVLVKRAVPDEVVITEALAYDSKDIEDVEVIEEIDFSELAVKEKENEDDIDFSEVIDDAIIPSTEVIKHEEEIINIKHTFKGFDFGFGPGTIEINIHD